MSEKKESTAEEINVLGILDRSFIYHFNENGEYTVTDTSDSLKAMNSSRRWSKMELHEKYVTTIVLTWDMMRTVELEINLLEDAANYIAYPEKDMEEYEKRILKEVMASLQNSRKMKHLLEILEDNLYSMYYDNRVNDGGLYMDALLKEAAMCHREVPDGT